MANHRPLTTPLVVFPIALHKAKLLYVVIDRGTLQIVSVGVILICSENNKYIYQVRTNNYHNIIIIPTAKYEHGKGLQGAHNNNIFHTNLQILFAKHHSMND